TMALGTLGGESSAAAINDAGQVVGVSGAGAFLWTPGSGMVGLGVPGYYSSATSINGASQVVGSYGKIAGDHRAYVGAAGAGLVDLGGLADRPFSGAISTNDNGQIAGTVFAGSSYSPTSHAVVWTYLETREARADFNGDGRADLLWRNASGQL